ncbi:hypothetical protein RHORCCE3_0186 [Rickettsia hoogstraalii str. RCCE3]|nr:hypothetical protein RHORCCE3_0186 [Rickettsia hoogstraalii str. RCCE3]
MKTFYLFVLALTLCSCGIKKPLEAPEKEAKRHCEELR